MYLAMLLSLNYQVRFCELEKKFQCLSVTTGMPALSKRARMLNEVAEYHVQWKCARILHMLTQFMDDLLSSNTQTNPSLSSPFLLSTTSCWPCLQHGCSQAHTRTYNTGHQLVGGTAPKLHLRHSDLFSKDIIVWFNTIVYNGSEFAHRVWVQFF